jgi:hypothetical protein
MLPTTNDIDALIALRPRLLDVGSGDGRHAFASDAPRCLSVFWADLASYTGWGWRTRSGDERDAGTLDSLEDLDRMIAWVDERPHLAGSDR